MADGTKNNIKQWQDINGLNRKLFNSYDEVLSKFKIRNNVIFKSTTSHGNPREYILIEANSDKILNLPEGILKILEDTLKSNCNTVGLPF